MSGLFGSSPTIMPAPTPTPPPPMPDPFGPAGNEAARMAATNAAARTGRNATILTTAASRAGNTIAGGTPAAPYTASKLSGS